MKKYQIALGAVLLSSSSMTFTSCIGSFALTKRVLTWNKQVGNKFINELVFFAFWVLPVYEVTSLADLIVINSIEFWSGNNPVTASTKVVDTEHGRYLIKCDGHGYDVTYEPTGRTTRLEFLDESDTWAIKLDNGELLPFMTFVDDSHVSMRGANGEFRVCELSEQGVMAYIAGNHTFDLASR